MSRIGNKPIPIPSGVKCEIKGDLIKVVGPKGTLEKEVRPEIEVVEEGNTLTIKGRDDSKKTNAFRGLTKDQCSIVVLKSSCKDLSRAAGAFVH